MSLNGDSRFAGFLLRLLAFAIDTIILSAGMFILQVFLRIPIHIGYNTTPMNPMLFSYNLAAVVIVWLYYALFESGKWQATIGKRFCKIKVTDYHGKRISFGRATGRYFSKYLSTIIFFIGYIMVIFTEKSQALHDMIAKTYVMKD